MQTVLIAGSRTWKDVGAIRDYMSSLQAKTKLPLKLVHGKCPTGADYIANKLAKELGYGEIKAYPADWNRYKKAACPIRNQQMIDIERPHYAAVFIEDESKGSEDMLQRLERYLLSGETRLKSFGYNHIGLYF
jgi:hypothetical protein